MQNATMLYKLGGQYKHYEPKIGYINYDYIIVDASEVQDYIYQGWALNVTELYLESLKPKDIILPVVEKEIEQPINKSFKGKKIDVGDDNL